MGTTLLFIDIRMTVILFKKVSQKQPVHFIAMVRVENDTNNVPLMKQCFNPIIRRTLLVSPQRYTITQSFMRVCYPTYTENVCVFMVLSSHIHDPHNVNHIWLTYCCLYLTLIMSVTLNSHNVDYI